MNTLAASDLHASGDTIYRQTLRTTEAGLQSALNSAESSADAGRQQIGKLYDKIPDTIIESSDAKPVSFTWLKNELKRIRDSKQKKWIPDAKKLLSEIESLKAASTGINQSNTRRDIDAKRKLAVILKKSEYKESLGEQLLIRMLEKFSGFLAGVFGSKAAVYIGWILAGLLVLVFVVAIVYLIMSLISKYTGRSKSVRVEKLIESIKARPSFESMLEKSAHEAAEGRYRDAFRSLYLASIIMLDKSSLIVYTDSITNWEYLRVIRKQAPPEAITIFNDMTLMFDILIYGHRDVSQSEYDEELQRFRQLEALI